MIGLDGHQILFVDQGHAEGVLEPIISGLDSRGNWRGEVPNRRKDGSRLWCQVSVSTFDHGAFGPVTVSVHTDVSQAKENEKQLTAKEAQHRAVLATAPDGIIVIDSNGLIQVANPAVTDIFGFRNAELVGHNVSILMPEPDKGQHNGYLDRYVESQTGTLMNTRRDVNAQRKDGTIFPIELSVSEIKIDHQPTTFLGILRDVTHRKQNESRLTELAQSDQLTGLMNRGHFRNTLTESIANAVSTDRQGALLFVDLDNFKAVNDSYGHQVGDQVLVKVAELLHGAVRHNDAVGRIGGDEFAVIIEDIAGPSEAAATAERILAAINELDDVVGKPIDIGASIGIAVFPTDAANPDDLLNCADAAMYVVKATGGHRIEQNNPETRH